LTEVWQVWQSGSMGAKDPMAKTTLRLPTKLWREMRVKAINEGITAQQAVIRALEMYVRKGGKS
jgi:hypothetical protein